MVNFSKTIFEKKMGFSMKMLDQDFLMILKSK